MGRPAGLPKTGGRQKGTPNKLTADVKAAFEEAFALIQSDKKAKLPVWGRENPGAFYQLASKLIPTKNDVEITQRDGYSPIERAARVIALFDAATAERARQAAEREAVGTPAGTTDGSLLQ